jgi:hypothetical protein
VLNGNVFSLCTRSEALASRRLAERTRIFGRAHGERGSCVVMLGMRLHRRLRSCRIPLPPLVLVSVYLYRFFDHLRSCRLRE